MSEKVRLHKLPARVANKIDVSGDCWLWTASTITNGYGHLRINGKLILSHRFVWEFFNGPVPLGLYVLHKCDVRNCVNPEHLFIGTHRDNAIDMFDKGRGYTPKGEGHGRSKLTQEQVSEIRSLYKKGTNVQSEYSQAALAKKFGVTPGHIHRIVSNRLWKTEA
jgi:hypothetical protein